MRYERGQVVWADFSPVVGHEQAGHRPALILSETRFNAASRTVIAVPLTSKQPRAPYPFAFEIKAISKRGGERSWAKPSQVRTLSVERLGEVELGRAEEFEIDACLDAISEVCGRRGEVKHHGG